MKTTKKNGNGKTKANGNGHAKKVDPLEERLAKLEAHTHTDGRYDPTSAPVMESASPS